MSQEFEVLGQELEKLKPISKSEVIFGIKSKNRHLEEITPADLDAANGEVRLNKDGYETIFPKPFYINQLRVLGRKDSNEAPLVIVEYRFIDTDGWVRPGFAQKKDDTAESIFKIERVVTAFRIIDDSGLFSYASNVRAVLIDGWTMEELKEAEAFAKQGNGLKERLQKYIDSEKNGLEISKTSQSAEIKKAIEEIEKSKATLQTQKETVEKNVTDLNSQIQTLESTAKAKNTELASLEKSIQSSIEKRDTLTADLNGKTQSLNEVKNRLDTLNDRCQEKESEIQAKTSAINLLHIELTKLQSDKSLFTDDMIGFAKHGSSQIKIYVFVIILPLIIGGLALSGFGVYNSFELFHTFVEKPEINIWHLLAAKAPLVIVLSAALAFCFKVAKIFINRIIEIHARRLRLSEITMLSKKFSDDVSEELTLDQNIRASLLMKTRLTLVREYLSGAFDSHIPQHSPSVWELANKIGALNNIATKEPTQKTPNTTNKPSTTQIAP